MQIIAVANHKGGVGKTTLTACLAAALIERDKRVLVIDLDEQGSASDWLGNTRERPGSELCRAIVAGEGLGELVQETACGVDLIAACESFHSIHAEAENIPGKEFLLRDVLATLEPRWDYVFFDCPPSLQLVTASALVAADFLLIPVEAKFLSLRPLGRLFQLFQGVQKRLNPKLRLAGIVGGKVRGGTTHCREIVARLRESFPEGVFHTVIRDSIRIGEAPGHAKGITHYDSTGHGAADFRALAAEFEERVAAVEQTDPKPRRPKSADHHDQERAHA